MRFITTIVFTIVALVNAKPIPNWNTGGMAIPLTRHFSFNKSINIRDAIRSHGISVEEKILSGLDNYEMNTGTMHPFAVKRSESRLKKRGASVPLTTYEDIMWSAEISIGTPAKTFIVHIDTGAADMWVLETGCIGIFADQDLWDPNLSKSAKKEEPFQLQYAEGTIVTGDKYTDNVTVAGFTADPQTFGSVKSYTSNWQLPDNGKSDGLLGLAFPSVSRFRAYPLLASLVTQGNVINPTFSLKLTSSGAEMYVGGANSMLYNGNIAYTRVTHSGFWQVSMDDVRVNGKKVLENVPVIFDSGASYIFGDWNHVSELYGPLGGILEEYKGYGFYYLPCDSFPRVSFTFSGNTFEISPEVLVQRIIEKGSLHCFGAIVARRSPLPYWSIGITFLQGVYSVFDYNALQVGFAKLA